MRKTLIVTCAFVFASALSSVAQSKKMVKKKEKKQYELTNSLSLYPFAFAASSFMVGYEHRLNEFSALRMNGALGFSDNSNYYSLNQNVSFSGYYSGRNMNSAYGEIQYRKYFKKALDGFYAGPYAYFKNMSLDVDRIIFDPNNGTTLTRTDNLQMSAIGLGVLIGYNVNIDNTATLDFYVGGGPNIASGDYKIIDVSPFDSWKRGMAPQIGFSLGLYLNRKLLPNREN